MIPKMQYIPISQCIIILKQQTSHRKTNDTALMNAKIKTSNGKHYVSRQVLDVFFLGLLSLELTKRESVMG